MGVTDGPTLIGSVQRAFRLLEAMSAHENGAPAKQLARETGLPLATAYHLLRTLVHDGYVRKLPDGGFILGERLQTLHTTGRAQALLSRIRPTLAALRDELSSAAYLTFYEEGEIRVAEIVDGPRAPRVDLWVGFEDAGHATALGKSVLRELDEEASRLSSSGRSVMVRGVRSASWCRDRYSLRASSSSSRSTDLPSAVACPASSNPTQRSTRGARGLSTISATRISPSS